MTMNFADEVSASNTESFTTMSDAVTSVAMDETEISLQEYSQVYDVNQSDPALDTIWRCVVPVLFVMGLLGNTVLLFVSGNGMEAVLIRSGALVDALCLLVPSISSGHLLSPRLDLSGEYRCRTYIYLFFVTLYYSVWQAVLSRFVVVMTTRHPVKSRLFFSVQKLTAYVVALGVVLFLDSIPQLIQFEFLYHRVKCYPGALPVQFVTWWLQLHGSYLKVILFFGGTTLINLLIDAYLVYLLVVFRRAQKVEMCDPHQFALRMKAPWLLCLSALQYLFQVPLLCHLSDSLLLSLIPIPQPSLLLTLSLFYCAIKPVVYLSQHAGVRARLWHCCTKRHQEPSDFVDVGKAPQGALEAAVDGKLYGGNLAVYNNRLYMRRFEKRVYRPDDLPLHRSTKDKAVRQIEDANISEM